MSEQIKPCPFCGHVGLDFAEGSTFRWMLAVCDGCGANCGEERVQTSGDGSREEWWTAAKDRAIATWNTRATQPQAPQGAVTREQLEAAFEAEIAKVSHVAYDSNEICRHFFNNIRAALLAPETPEGQK